MMEMGHTHGQGALERVTSSFTNRAAGMPQPHVVQVVESSAPGAAGVMSCRLSSLPPPSPVLTPQYACASLQAYTPYTLGFALGSWMGRCYLTFPFPLKLSKEVSAPWVGRSLFSPVLPQSLIIVCMCVLALTFACIVCACHACLPHRP